MGLYTAFILYTAVFLTWSLFSDEISPRVDSKFVHCCSVQPLRGSDELQTLQDLFSMSFGSVFVSVFVARSFWGYKNHQHLALMARGGTWWNWVTRTNLGICFAFEEREQEAQAKAWAFFGLWTAVFFWVDSGVDEGRNYKKNSIKVREKWKRQHLFQHSECELCCQRFFIRLFCGKKGNVANDEEILGQTLVKPWGEKRVGFVSTRLEKNEGYPQKMSSYFKGISPESDCKFDIG